MICKNKNYKNGFKQFKQFFDALRCFKIHRWFIFNMCELQNAAG